MTKFYSLAGVGVDDGTVPFVPGDAALRGGKVHALVATIDLAANAVLIGDTIDWGSLPKGAVPIIGFLTGSVSMGTAVLDVGITGTAAAFRAAATFTAVDTPTAFMKGSAIGIAMTGTTRVQSVIATGNMPNSATNKLTMVLLYTTPHSG